MKTVRKDLSSEDKSRQIFRQNHQNYRHRGINPWQKQSLPICRFSGCKKSSRLRDTESWLDLMNLITCLICRPNGERKFLLKSFYRNHEKVVGSGGLLMSYLKDYSLFSLLNSSKPMAQCTNERLEYLLSKVPSRRGELSDRDPYRLEYELCYLGFLPGTCVMLFSRSKPRSIQIE